MAKMRIGELLTFDWRGNVRVGAIAINQNSLTLTNVG